MTQRDINNINSRIKLIRKRLEVRQKYMAASLGITQGYLSDIERGNKTPSDTLLIALMNRWGIRHDYLYEGKGEMFIPKIEQVAEETPAYDLPPKLRALRDMLKQIYIEGSTEERAKVEGIINAVHEDIERKKKSRFQKPQRESDCPAEDEPEQKSA